MFVGELKSAVVVNVDCSTKHHVENQTLTETAYEKMSVIENRVNKSKNKEMENKSQNNEIEN